MDSWRTLLGEYHSSTPVTNMHLLTLAINMDLLTLATNTEPQPALLGADLFRIREQRQRHSG
jgi:hypothetical protein